MPKHGKNNLEDINVTSEYGSDGSPVFSNVQLN